jgi:ABC-type transport system involved in multi-copper enzyme maturation permease subunit
VFATLVAKELKAILLSPKFAVTFGVCAVLVLLSVFAGVREFKADRAAYETAQHLALAQASESNNWRNFTFRALREPDPLRAFVSGLSSDIGRWSQISQNESVQLRHSAYSDDPLFALFRMLDFSLIVSVVLSLFAILFTYDAVSGEREAGTLKLVFANGVPRGHYLAAKCLGAWLGLVMPLTIPVLLAVMLAVWMGLPLAGDTWLRLLALMGVSLLYFTFFIALGVLISAVTRRSSTSFLVSLVVWLAFVLIIPRGGMMAAGQLVNVPRMAEIEGKRDAFASELWQEHYKAMEGRLREEREAPGSGNQDSDAAMWERMQREDSLRRLVEQRIAGFEAQLKDDLEKRKRAQERLALTISRFSPVSAYQLAVMELAGTDVAMKSRYEEAMSRYREVWGEHVKTKQAETGQMGGFVSVEISSETGLKIGGSRGDEQIDITDMPRFEPPRLILADVLPACANDVGILALGVWAAFFGAFVAFLRYDVR